MSGKCVKCNICIIFNTNKNVLFLIHFYNLFSEATLVPMLHKTKRETTEHTKKAQRNTERKTKSLQKAKSFFFRVFSSASRRATSSKRGQYFL